MNFIDFIKIAFLVWFQPKKYLHKFKNIPLKFPLILHSFFIVLLSLLFTGISIIIVLILSFNPSSPYLVISPFLIPLLIFVASLLVLPTSILISLLWSHLLVIIFKGKNDFKQSCINFLTISLNYYLLAFIATIILLPITWIPIIGTIIDFIIRISLFIWMSYILVLVFSKTHNMPTLNAILAGVLAVLIPLIIGVIALFYFLNGIYF